MKVVESIDNAFIRISKTPLAFPICFDVSLPRPDIRQIIVHSTFKVIYRIVQDTIEVIEIFHGNRNDELLQHID